MGYTYDEKGYKRDDDGSFFSQEEVDRAKDNGDLTEYGNGKYLYDRETGEEFWSDGTKR